MESPKKIPDPAQARRLEEPDRSSVEPPELCASLGDYQPSLIKFRNRKDIFEHAVKGLRQIVPIAFYAFYSINGSDSDITPEHFDSPGNADYIRHTVDQLIDKGTVLQAVKEKRTITARTGDRRYNMLIHTMETASRPHGIFFCFLEKTPFEMEIVYRITTIIMKSASYALENFELYKLLDRKNEELTEKNTRLSASEKIYRNIFENTGNPTIITDSAGMITHSNSQFLAFSGCERKDLVNRRNIADFISGSGRADFPGLLRETGKDRPCKPRDYTFESRGGEQKKIILKISSLGLDNKYIITLNDVTRLKEAEKQLEFQAFHDPLTRLPNRVLFQDRLKQAIKKKKRYKSCDYAVLFIDIDRFKVINDTLGHGTGDKLLVDVSRRISRSVREIDTVARFGGDEFLVLLDDIKTRANCDIVAQRILNNFRSTAYIEGSEIMLTISMGIFLSSEHQVGEADVVRLADISMYEAKKQGRNRVVYAHEIGEMKIEDKQGYYTGFAEKDWNQELQAICKLI